MDSTEKDPSIITRAPKIPGYTILSQLGEGGMATVFLAIQESFGRKVALKVLMPKGQQDSSFNERFAREARIVARLSHPNIIPVYDVGQVDDYHYISMEYLSGADLASRIKKRMKAGEIIRVTKEIALALDYAHRKGYVHRDVKPDNILFREDGAAVLTDFGIARPAAPDSNMTQVGKVIGTPKYMSPEQTRGEELNSTCDLYALGIMLFEMLTGKVPFDGRDPFDIGIKHLKDPVPRLPAPMAVFQPLIDGLLAKDRQQRIQTGREVVDMLEQIHQQLAQRAAARKQGQSGPQPAITGAAAASNAGQETSASGMRADASDRPVAAAAQDQAKANATSSRSPWPLLLVLLVLLLGGGVAAIWFAPQYAASQPSLMAAHERLMQWLGIVDPVEQEIERRLAAAQAAEQQGQYLEPVGSSALDHYRAILSLRSDHPAAKAGLAAVVQWLLGQAREAIDEQDFVVAEQRLDRAAQIDANAAGLAEARDAMARERARLAEEEAARQAEALARQQQLEADRLANEQRSAAEAARQRELAARRAAEQAAAEKARQEALRKQQEAELLRQQELDRQRAEEEAAAAMFRNVRIRGLLAKADTHFTRGEYYRPAGENALDAYVEVLSLDGDSIAAKAGIEKTMERIIPELERLLQAQQFDQARDLYQQLRDKAPASSNLLSFGDSKGW